MAEEFKYQNQVYCVVCDTDINETWVTINPKKSKIKYFAPSTWARDRLKLYGVNPQDIFLTGYPFPQENLGKNLETLKDDIRHRLINLDPQKKYRKLYAPLIGGTLGKLPEKSNHPLTIMFSIGGAALKKKFH